MNLEHTIEAILFFKSEPVSARELSSATGASLEDVREACERLHGSLQERGIVLLRKDERYMLGTHPHVSALIEKLHKEDLNRDLGKAGIETLTAVLYRGPLTRSQIDYIRGVNSSFTLRHLLVRGLIERTPNQKDQRSFLYRPTFELLSFLGVSRVEELPEYESVRARIEEFENAAPPAQREEP